MNFIQIIKKGEIEPCSICGCEINVLKTDALHARFLMVRVRHPTALGGGRCLPCGKFVCERCAAKTIYGEALRRLHCPECGGFLTGLRAANSESVSSFGAFLDEEPGMSGANG
jgi:hypothetical protein